MRKYDKQIFTVVLRVGPFKNPKDGERRKKTPKDIIFIKLKLQKSTIMH